MIGHDQCKPGKALGDSREMIVDNRVVYSLLLSLKYIGVGGAAIGYLDSHKCLRHQGNST